MLFRDQTSQYFDLQTPPGLLHRLVVLTLRAYRDAFDFCDQGFGPNESHDLVGHYRRALIETAFGGLAGSFPVSVTKVLNPTSSAYHTEIRYKQIALTESKIEENTRVLPEARFRQTLAMSTQQGFFFGTEPPPEGTPLWASLVHGPGLPGHATPGFMKIVFPDQDGRFAGNFIDLFARFTDLRPRAVDAVSDAGRTAIPAPKLRPGVARPDVESIPEAE